MNSQGVQFGVDYYPEFVDRSFWDDDLKRIRAMGLQTVRLMEFAWALLEPREGHFDPSLFDEILSLVEKHGLKAVLGTPTATFPVWLYDKDPTIMQVYNGPFPNDFGSRRKGCFNAPVYREATARITQNVVEHFAKHPTVIGWQVDNEIGHEGSDRCYCAHCKSAWHRWLETKYHTVDAMNQTWGTVFWGTIYSRFDQVPVARKQFSTQLNPTLVLDYDRFCSDSAVKFVDDQLAILKRHKQPAQWLSTNLYPVPHGVVIDMEHLMRGMDFPGFDNYPVWGDMEEPHPYFFNAYMMAYVRGLKKTGLFTVFEQMTGIQAHSCLGYLPSNKQLALWVNQAVAHGANQLFYFSWRTPASGQEQLCYGVINTDNEPSPRQAALQSNMEANAAAFERFAQIPFQAEACLMYDKDNARVMKEQYLSKAMQVTPTAFLQVGYDKEMARCYAPFGIFNINTDVVSADSAEVSKYKLISLPMYELAEPSLVDRLTPWVEQGGTLILHWRCGTRDKRSHNVDVLLPGLFADLAGVRVREFESLNNKKIKARLGLIPFSGEVWADLLEPTTAKPLAFYRDASRHYKGTPCVTVNVVGKGRVYYLGTSPDPLGLYFLYKRIFKEAGMRARFYGQGIEVIERNTTDGGRIDLILNHTAKSKRVLGIRVPANEMKIKTY